MRGIAASAVMLCHFTYANENFRDVFPTFSLLFSYGGLGVWMFFVISGFVIPYAMDGTKYRISSGAWPFFLRRIVRLEPPYIASVFLAFAVAYVAARTPGYRGQPFAPSLTDFLLQFLYLGPWFEVPWINGVAWTLAIEFQYYLIMLLAAPLLLSRSTVPVAIFLALVVASSLLIDDRRALFVYLPCFAVGFAVFLFHTQRVGAVAFTGLCFLFVGLLAHSIGTPAAVAAAASAGLILLPLNRPVPILSFLGAISYSLYLIHAPIGDRIVNLAMRDNSNFVQMVGLAGAIAVSLLVAVTLWYVIERPAQLWAKLMYANGARPLDAVPSALQIDEVGPPG